MSDSNASSAEDLSDLEFISNQTTNKKRKMNPASSTQAVGSQHSTIAPPRKYTAHKQLGAQKSAAAAVQQVRPGPSQKREVTPADVIDLVDTSPPRQRQAVEKHVVGTEIVSKDLDRRRLHQTAQQSSSSPSQALSRIQVQKSIQLQAQNIDPAQIELRGLTQVQRQEPRLTATEREPTQTADDLTALARVKDLSQLVGVLMRGQAESAYGLTQEVEGRLKCIERTVEREPGQLLYKMLQDLHSADAANADLRSMLHDLVGRRQFHQENSFPRVPDQTDIDKGWKTFRKYVRDAFGYGYPSEPKPRGIDAGYIAARIDDLAKDGRHPLGSPTKFTEELTSYLHSPHSVQALLSALLCRWLFAAPEPICKGAYSLKELKMYESVLLNSKRSISTQHSCH